MLRFYKRITTLSIVLGIALLSTIMYPTDSVAQVTLTNVSGPNFSLTNSTFPTYQYPLTTVTGNGTAKFTIGSAEAVRVRVTGTYSVASTQLLTSNDNTNFTLLPLYPVAGGGVLTTITTNGDYFAILPNGTTQMQVSNAGTFTGTSQILKITGSGLPGLFRPLAADPCQDMYTSKQSIAVSVSSAGTTALVAPVAGQIVYPCEISVVIGASTTLTLVTGTGATCGTGTTSVSGVVPASTYYIGFGGTFVSLVSGSGLCLTDTGTGGINGTLTYVQR